jgi:hypothetical protein
MVMFGGYSELVAAESPDIKNYLTSFQQASQWETRVAIAGDSKYRVLQRPDGDEHFTSVIPFTFYRDQENMESFGKRYIEDDTGNVTEDSERAYQQLYANQQQIYSSNSDDERPHGGMITNDYDSSRSLFLANSDYGFHLDGRSSLWGTHKSIADWLIESNAQLIDTESLDGREALVVSAMTPYGKITAWLAGR